MKPHVSAARPAMGILALALALIGPPARAQLPSTEERLKILTDPESIKAKLEKDKSRPPLEFFRSQVAPFDILPYLKANHWSTLSLELRANYDDYAGMLQTAPVALQGMPQEIVYRREARLVKEQRMHPGLQIMLPSVPKEINVELIRPEAIRPDEVWQASLRVLEPHQMLILVLTKASNDAYARWARMNALTPSMLDRGDPLQVDRQRYYRLVLPLEPDQPPLSAHPLTWTTISHVVWDGMEPETLNPPQQQAMLDWLHWGGQLILVGGARPSFQALRDSFLAPYLPADPTGESALLGEAELAPLSVSYRPPVIVDREDLKPTYPAPEPVTEEDEHYRGPDPIRPARNRPVFVAGLKPREGSSPIPMGEASGHLLGVERRVGRGRVLMLTVDLNDPALTAWAGLDTMIRRVVLRRPEEFRVPPPSWSDPTGGETPRESPLTGPELSWFRYLGRDLGGSIRRVETEAEKVEIARAQERWRAEGEAAGATDTAGATGRPTRPRSRSRGSTPRPARPWPSGSTPRPCPA